MIDISQVKKLRESTGAGMMDCKKALEGTNNDIDKAVEILRKKGEKIADKKSSRTANEGIIALVKDSNKVAVVELSCETDFVARNQDFVKTTDEFANKLMEIGKENFESWAKDKIQNELIVKIGENLQLGSFDIIEGNIINAYLHSNKKIASVVVLSDGDEELAKEIAMHVAAMNPQYLRPEDVPADVIEKEKEIYREQLKSEDKPKDILEKIIEGKLNKFYQDVCLVKQVYIKDDKISIEELLSNNNASIEKFTRYSL